MATSPHADGLIMRPVRQAVLIGIVLVTLGVSTPSGQGTVVQRAMQDKLAAAQALLGAIVQADFPAIARSVDRLSWISDAEIASWQTAARPDYVRQATVFLLAVEGLREAAETRDIEAATVEYGTLVSSCIRCHTSVRDSARVGIEPPSIDLHLLARRLP